MKIETKYNIGDTIWIVYKHNDEITMYEDVIEEVLVRDMMVTTEGVSELKRVIEYIGDKCPDGILEEDIVLYNDSDKLVELIRRLNNEKKQV